MNGSSSKSNIYNVPITAGRPEAEAFANFYSLSTIFFLSLSSIRISACFDYQHSKDCWIISLPIGYQRSRIHFIFPLLFSTPMFCEARSWLLID